MKIRSVIILLIISISIFLNNPTKASELHIAAINGDIQAIERALSTGKDINEIGSPYNNDEFEGTPLHWAVFAEKEEATIYLIKNGANINIATDGCCVPETPLDIAVRKKNIKIIQILLKANANVEGISENRVEWPLLSAIAGGHIETAKMLLDYGADINRRGVDDYNVFHYAISCNQIDSLKYLLSKGMNVNEKTGPLSQYETALHIAAVNRNIEMAKILIENGAEINSIDSNGDTSLHIAVKKGSKDFIELLLKSGAKTNIKNKLGKTPLTLAVEKGNQAIIDLLKNIKPGG